MCGIAGIIDHRGTFGPARLADLAAAMGETLAHRGPDDAGVWVDPSGICALAHRRLSIIDTSAAGHQPMVSGDGNHVITFNGEIYNYRGLRDRLTAAGCSLTTATDTEVLLEMSARDGVEALREMDGMYAFALWDSSARRLLLARDPLGKKPLYVAERDGWLAFASDMRAFRRIPEFRAIVDRKAIAEYLLLQYVLAPRAIYEGTSKVPPGTWLSIDFSGVAPQRRQAAHFVPKLDSPEPSSARAGGSLERTVERLREELIRAVDVRLESDVPLGAFLSGGIDSAVVAAIVRRELGRPLATFSLGFESWPESEHIAARQVAGILGTEHHEQVVAPHAVELIPRIAACLDEPLGDSGCLPAYLLSAFTRQHVTVALSGDGGDELFGGYNRYRITLAEEGDRWARLRQWVRGGRRWTPSGAYCSHRWLMFLPAEIEALLGGEAKAHAEGLVRSWGDELENDRAPLLRRMQQLDSTTYLPGAVLAKVDRMSMAFALEVRCPLLSRRIADLASTIPAEYCHRDGVGKVVLRALASRYFPAEYVARPKTGFGLPTGAWSKDEMLGMCDRLMRNADSRAAVFLDQGGLGRFLDRQRWPGHFSVFQVWTLLMLELWLRAQEGYTADGSWGTTPNCSEAA